MSYRFLTTFLLVFSTFTAISQCCDHYIYMADSYGDGWNGGALEVFINGESIGEFAAENYSSAATISVCPGDELQLSYSPGDYENENSYTVLDAVGAPIFQDGPEPQVGNVVTLTVSCESDAIPGDFPCVALPLDTNSCVIVDNTGMIGSGFTPNCSFYNGGDLWFAVEVPESGNITVSTNQAPGSGINDTGVALWTGDSCAGLSLVACDDDSGEGYLSFVTLDFLEPGSTVYIQLWIYGGGATGEFEVCFQDLGGFDFSGSELPLVDIQTGGQTIPDEPKITASMRLIYNGIGNLSTLADSANHYYGQIGIEIRGASSAGYPQTPYGFETRDADGNNNNVPLLDMPAENDWVLLSNYNDKSFIRNTFSQHIFQEMGHYAPRMTLCEVFIDDSYRGIYVIGEKIKTDNNRLNIADLSPNDNEGNDVTGGYIFKSDLAWGDNYWTSNYHPIDHPEYDVRFVYHDPKPEDITDPQKEYIASFLDSMETAMYGVNFADTALGYRKYLDELSFIDYFLLNELSRNNDGFKKSRYYFKDKHSNGGKLHAGPTWDFDWAWKDLYSCSIFENQDGSGWAHLINDCPTDNYSPGWYLRMFEDSTFSNTMRCRYEELRSPNQVLDTTVMFHYIDSVATLIENAQGRHYQKWPTLGVGVGAPEMDPLAETFEEEIEKLKNWISLRITWLDDNIPGICLGEPTLVAQSANRGFKLYPNPSSGKFTIEGIEERNQLNLYSSTGRLVRTISMTSDKRKCDFTVESPGVYFYQLVGKEGPIHSGKLVVQ